MTDIRERLREAHLISNAYEARHITSYSLAERLITERREAADTIDKLVEALGYIADGDYEYTTTAQAFALEALSELKGSDG